MQIVMFIIASRFALTLWFAGAVLGFTPERLTETIGAVSEPILLENE